MKTYNVGDIVKVERERPIFTDDNTVENRIFIYRGKVLKATDDKVHVITYYDKDNYRVICFSYYNDLTAWAAYDYYTPHVYATLY